MLNKKVLNDSIRNLNKPSKITNKNSVDTNNGADDDGFISAKNGVETPIYKAVKVGPSSIEGKGLFAEEAIKKGDIIGISHIRKNFKKNGEEYRAPFPSTVLGYYNHSEEPNVYEVDKGDYILMVAKRNIPRGHELTSDYTKHNIGDLETPENFKKGGSTKRPKIPKGKSPKSYSRSFEATNRLFAENPLFAKPKSRKNKIFDPRAKYYAKGGITYNNLPATYQSALQNFIYPNVIDDPERTGYNSVNSTISYDSQSPIENMDNAWWREHELFHDLQNQAGGMSTSGIVGQRPNPYVASDEAMQGYYDRRDADVNRTIDSMIAENPELQFIPRNKLAEGSQPGFVGAEDLQYSDPSTLEGEARQYEQYIREGNPSIFAKGGFSKRLLRRYPGMQGVYGSEGENLNIIKDPNYKASDYGFGNIEFILPGTGLVTYSDDYQYQSPTPDKYTAVYNPKGANKHDVFLDMLHGMRDDPEYMKLLEEFANNTKSARGESMDHWFNYDTENNPYAVMDGRETWDKNFIDGVLRSHIAKKGMGRHSSDAKGYKLERQGSSPEMYKSANKIYKYLKGKHKDGGISLELTEAEIKKYVDGGYIVEELPKAANGGVKKMGNSGPSAELTENLLSEEEICGEGYAWDGQSEKCVPIPDMKDWFSNWYSERTLPLDEIENKKYVNFMKSKLPKYNPSSDLLQRIENLPDPTYVETVGDAEENMGEVTYDKDYNPKGIEVKRSLKSNAQELGATLAHEGSTFLDLPDSDVQFPAQNLVIDPGLVLFKDRWGDLKGEDKATAEEHYDYQTDPAQDNIHSLVFEQRYKKDLKPTQTITEADIEQWKKEAEASGALDKNNPNFDNSLYTLLKLSKDSKSLANWFNQLASNDRPADENAPQYAKYGRTLQKARYGKAVKTVKDLGRAANIGTFGTANTLAKTVAPIMINPARVPLLGARIENVGPFTGSPLNKLPFYGKEIEASPNTAFRKFGDTLDYVKLSGELNPAHGPLIRMGKDQIMNEGNWAALNQPNEWYPGVMAAKFDFNTPGTNLGFTKLPGRDGVLITDAMGNKMPSIPITDPGLSFQRRLPFSNRYVDVNMEKLRNNQFDFSTVGTNTQALLERYGYGMGYAALLGAMGLSTPQNIIDDYINKPLVEGYKKYIQPAGQSIYDFWKPKNYRLKQDGTVEEYSKGGLTKFVNGGDNDCPDGYIKDENGNCIPANYNPNVANENTEFLKSMANSPLFVERYARMVGKPLEEVTQEAEDYRKQILQNIETTGMGDSAYPPQPYKTASLDAAAYYSPMINTEEYSNYLNEYSKTLNKVEKWKNEIPNRGKRNKEMRARHQFMYDKVKQEYEDAKKAYDEKLKTGHKIYFDVNEWDQPTDLHERSHASVKGNLQVAKPYKHKDFSKEEFNFMKEYLETRYPEDKKWYYEDADEIKARKDVAAKVMMKLGLYDPINETFTPEHYKKLRKLMGSGDLDEDTERQLEDITRPFTEEETIRMFNDIVQNDSDNDIQYGKYGGQFELGDEVDEATMKQLMKLGYTFEKI